jgi:hypothetical protein
MPADNESAFSIDRETSEVLAELSAREPIFHRPEFGTTRADFEKMTVEDFWEVGASGRIYSRSEVLDTLEKRYSRPHRDVQEGEVREGNVQERDVLENDVWETMDFRCRKLAPDVYLLTYTLIQDGTRHTRRSTIWQRTTGGWKIVYHQGTVVAP